MFWGQGLVRRGISCSRVGKLCGTIDGAQAWENPQSMDLLIQLYQQGDGEGKGVPPEAVAQARLGNYTAGPLLRDAATARAAAGIADSACRGLGR